MPSKKISPVQVNVGNGIDGEAPVVGSDSERKSKPFWRTVYVWVFFFAGFIVSVVAFAAISQSMRELVQDTYELCSKSSGSYSLFKNPPEQSKPFWIHNLTNPTDFFINGEDAELHEIGPFSLTYNKKNRDVSFKDDVLEVLGYDIYHFDASGSCPWCQDMYQSVSTVHVAYNTIISKVGNEGAFLLSQACTPTQIGLIAHPNSSIEYCTESELLTSENCRCCYPAQPQPNAVPCASLTSSISPAGERLSWLAKYEGGHKISDTVNPDGFPLAPGVYTTMSRKTTPSELAFGTPSTFAGFFSYGISSTSAKHDMENITRDMGAVCRPLFCPSLSDIGSELSSMGKEMGYEYLKGIQCEGRVPGTAGLMSQLSMSEERALELRYLEGVSCRSYTPTLITAALIYNNSWAHACSNSEDTAPCCLSALQGSDGFRGTGWGCLAYFNGMVIPRRVYNERDAEAFATKHDSRGTNCATKSERQIVYKENGKTEFTRWITPESYSYPDMPWADPSVIRATGTSPNSNISKTVLGTQKYIGTNDYQPMKESLFLVGEEITDEKPEESNYIRKAFFPNALTERELRYEGTYMFFGLQTLKYRYRAENTTSDENSQRGGQLPYRNMQNLMYTGGTPVIISLPNFYGVDSRIFVQNRTANGPDGGGVILHRVADGYSSASKAFSAPSVIDAASNEVYADNFIFKLDYAAITGSGVRGQIPVQFSTFTLNCNPSLDQTCNFKTVPVGAGSELCYGFTNGMRFHRPCSALNVFTPAVRGERVIPILWFSNDIAVPEKKLEPFKIIVWVLYAACIGVIVFGALFLVSFLVWIYFAWKEHRQGENVAPDQGATFNKDSLLAGPGDENL